MTILYEPKIKGGIKMIKMIEGGVKLNRNQRLVRSLVIEKNVFKIMTGINYIPELFPHVDAKIKKLEELTKVTNRGGKLL